MSQASDACGVCRLLKLFKAVNLGQLTSPLERFFGSAQVSFARLLFFFFLIFHGTACGFHLIAMLGNERNSWIEKEGLVEARVMARYATLSCKPCMHAMKVTVFSVRSLCDNNSVAGWKHDPSHTSILSALRRLPLPLEIVLFFQHGALQSR